MALALSAAEWIERIEYPDPADFATDQAWVDVFLLGQAARGPRHGAQPVVDYASLWVLWLSALPYGLWSEQIARPALEEHVLWVRQLEQVLQRTLAHFDMMLREGITLSDLACAMAHLIEGVWLNQCLTERHPQESGELIAAVMLRSGRMLWNGATQARERKPTKGRRKF
jgi:hypothetical protein